MSRGALPRLQRQMTGAAAILAVCAGVLLVIGLSLDLPSIISLGGGGLLLLLSLWVLRYRRWLRRHPPGTDWQPTRGTRAVGTAMDVLTPIMNLAMVVLGFAILAMMGEITVRNLAHGDLGMLLLSIVVLLVVGRTIYRSMRWLRRDWHGLRRAGPRAKSDTG